MKKTFTLIAAVIFISAASYAQYNNNGGGRDNNFDRRQDVVINNGYDRDGDPHFGEREREKSRQIQQINWAYDRKIEQVEHNFFMGRRKKEYIIAELQEKREREIRFVVAKFNERHAGYDRRYDDDHDHGRRNW